MMPSLKDSQQYDERQIVARGYAFKYAYMTMLVALATLWLVADLLLNLKPSAQVMLAVPFWLSLTVLYYHLIRKDAYEGLSQGGTAGLVAIIMGFGGLFIILMNLYGLLSGKKQFIQQGALSPLLGSLIAGLCMLAVGLIYWQHRRHTRKQPAED